MVMIISWQALEGSDQSRVTEDEHDESTSYGPGPRDVLKNLQHICCVTSGSHMKTMLAT